MITLWRSTNCCDKYSNRDIGASSPLPRSRNALFLVTAVRSEEALLNSIFCAIRGSNNRVKHATEVALRAPNHFNLEIAVIVRRDLAQRAFLGLFGSKADNSPFVFSPHVTSTARLAASAFSSTVRTRSSTEPTPGYLPTPTSRLTRTSSHTVV
jgi:hypothetical protein